MRRISWTTALISFALLAACPDPNGGKLPPPTNAGLSAGSMGVAGDFAVLFSTEAEEAADENADGDQQDEFVTIYDFADGTRQVLPFALSRHVDPRAKGGLFAFGASESGQGETDMNGDGDTDDSILVVFDARTVTFMNTLLAAAENATAIGDDLVAFAVNELAQGADLDGDGQLASDVLHVLDTSTGITTPSGFRVTGSVVANGDVFAFTTAEGNLGDLNGDGDVTDGHIFELYGPAFPAGLFSPSEIMSTPFALHDDWFVLVSEAGEGLDLDDDGDTDDGVWFVQHQQVATSGSLGVSSLAALGSRVTGEVVTLAAQEIDGIDRNGDGDLDDTLWVVHDPARIPVLETGLAAELEPAAAAGFIAFVVSEEPGQDLNGDGDSEDTVLEVFDPSTSELTNTGLSVFLPPRDDASRFVFARFEGNDGANWNGDGDQLDTVFWAFDPVRRRVRSTEIASFAGGNLGVSANRMLLLALETDERRDLNFDGDTDDRVYVVHEFGRRGNSVLELAATHTDQGGLTPDGHVGLLVGEDDQGEDLNGDGDRDDGVLFVLD